MRQPRVSKSQEAISTSVSWKEHPHFLEPGEIRREFDLCLEEHAARSRARFSNRADRDAFGKHAAIATREHALARFDRRAAGEVIELHQRAVEWSARHADDALVARG